MFDPKLLDESVLDEEMVAQFEKTYRAIKRFCERHSIDSVPYDEFREKLYFLWEIKINQTDPELIMKIQEKSDQIKKHKAEIGFNRGYIDLMMTYSSLLQEAKRRGISEGKALSYGLADMVKGVFGEVAIEI
jgi:hypothetical protein